MSMWHGIWFAAGLILGANFSYVVFCLFYALREEE